MGSKVHQEFHRPASIVNDILHDSTNVAIAFCKVKRSESCRGFVVVGMGLELEAGRHRVEDEQDKEYQKKSQIT